MNALLPFNGTISVRSIAEENAHWEPGEVPWEEDEPDPDLLTERPLEEVGIKIQTFFSENGEEEQATLHPVTEKLLTEKQIAQWQRWQQKKIQRESAFKGPGPNKADDED